jgi:hypothetical protein
MTKRRKLSDLIGEETQQTERISQALEEADGCGLGVHPHEQPVQETRGLQGREFDSRHSPSSNNVSSSIESTANDSVTAEVSELVTDKVLDSQANKVSDIQSNKVTELRTTKVSDSDTTQVSNSQTDELPKYLKLVRKEARLREDQLDSLTSLTRSLNRQRKGSGERITENTLIRVAVDLLMNQSDELKGTTEQELLASIVKS